MKLRQKTLVIVASTIAALVAALYIVLAHILLAGYQAAEARDVRANMQRVVTAYKSEVAYLQYVVTDWAYWNASYQFMVNGNPQYVQSNLNGPTLSQLQFNVIAYIEPNGQFRYATGYDTRTGQTVPLSPAARAALTLANPLFRFHHLASNHSGIVVLPHHVLILDAAQILTSNVTGPSHGILVFGRELNSKMLEYFHQLTDLPVQSARWAPQGSSPPWAASVRARLSLAHPYFAQPINAHYIAGYLVMPDIDHRPAVILRVVLPRVMYQQGLISLHYLLAALIVSGMVFLGLTLALLNRQVLSRITRLSEAVGRVRSKEDLTTRVDLKGSDEVAQLAHNFNRMLHDLQASLNREAQLKQQVQDLRIEIDEVKKAREVVRIVESDYFRDIQKRAEEMREKRQKGKSGHAAI